MTGSTELVIFDCDGVLVDSDRVSLEIQARHLTDLGLPMSAEDCSREFLGIGMESTLETIAGMLGRPVPEGWLDGLEAVENCAQSPESSLPSIRSTSPPASPPVEATRR